MTAGIMPCNGIVEERRRYNGSIPCRENKGLYDNEQSPSAQYGVVLKGKGAFITYELRKKRGWSQSDLARKLDKKTSTISSYETDSKTPSVDTIIAMSELFGVSIDELIYGENAEVLSTKHLAAEQKRAVADLLQGLTLYNDGNDKDGLARTRLLLQVIKAMGL